jgi:hypothetical protein
MVKGLELGELAGEVREEVFHEQYRGLCSGGRLQHGSAVRKTNGH